MPSFSLSLFPFFFYVVFFSQKVNDQMITLFQYSCSAMKTLTASS